MRHWRQLRRSDWDNQFIAAKHPLEFDHVRAGREFLGFAVECGVADCERFLGAADHFVEEQHFVLSAASIGWRCLKCCDLALMGRRGEETVVGVVG
jgi:hypothetical protein